MRPCPSTNTCASYWASQDQSRPARAIQKEKNVRKWCFHSAKMQGKDAPLPPRWPVRRVYLYEVA